jgi:hypothetical protein
VIYLSAGLYAEGPSDYRFLCPLLDRQLAALAAPLFPGGYEIADTIGVDARVPRGTRRADRIAAAVSEHADACEIFVIHTDGAGDPEQARRTCVEPGIAAARAAVPDRTIVAIGCVPVREIEAWLLTDPGAFRALFGAAIDLRLPTDPEKDIDPKATLRRILDDARIRPGPESVHAFFGERVSLDSLRALRAFRTFEADLVAAIGEVAASQGHRP